MLAWNVPLISPIFLKRSLVFPIIFFPFISLHCLFKKALSLLAFMDHSLVMACITQWRHESCHAGLPKMDESQWRVLTKCGPLVKEMATHSCILAMRNPSTVWKGKNMTLEDEHPPAYPRSESIQYITQGEWRAITNSSRKNEVTGPKQKWPQLWICLVVKIKSDAVKNNIV